MKTIRIFPVVTFLALIYGNSFAGWVITCKYTSGEGTELSERILIDQQKIKIELPDFAATFDLKDSTLILADPVNLTYYKGSLAEYNVGVKAFKLEALSESVNGIPDALSTESEKEYGSQIEHFDQLPELPSGIVVIEETQAEIKMAGYPAAQYNISLYGTTREEVWIAPALQAAAGFDWRLFFKFLKVTGIEDKALVYMNSTGYIDLIKTGLPLRRVKFTDGYRTEFQVTSLEEKIIPEYEFQTPALCKKLSVAGWLGQQLYKEEVNDDYE